MNIKVFKIQIEVDYDKGVLKNIEVDKEERGEKEEEIEEDERKEKNEEKNRVIFLEVKIIGINYNKRIFIKVVIERDKKEQHIEKICIWFVFDVYVVFYFLIF